MQKKILSTLVAMTLCFTSVFSIEAFASANKEDTSIIMTGDVTMETCEEGFELNEQYIEKLINNELYLNEIEEDDNSENKKTKKKVKKVKKNSIKDSTMMNIAQNIGKQTDYAYYSSTIMCSAYAFAYAYKQVTGKYITPGSVWYYGGCVWTGGTYRKYYSSTDMLSKIKSEIDKNRACVGLLSGQGGNTHYVTFYSYTGAGDSLDDFTVVDPWDGKIKNASNFGYYSYHVVTIN